MPQSHVVESPPSTSVGDDLVLFRLEIERLREAVRETTREYGLLFEALELARGDAYMLLLATKGYNSLRQ